MDDFSIWKTLVQTALVGTARSGLPPPLLEQLAQKGLDVYASPEEALLGAAALTRLRIKAGRIFPAWTAPLPDPVPTPTGVIHSQASRFLAILLSGRFAPAFEEWLELFAARKLTLPPESLPGLLTRCVEDDAIREVLEPHLGEWAHWLVAQNPDWAILALPEDPEIWQTGTKMERRALLKNIRKRNPSAALALLEETWDAESPAEKVVFLELVGDGLSIADEPFLQKAQADRRQEVRHAAGRLLVQIPGSGLHRKLLEIADSAISFDGNKVRLSLPKKWPEWPTENGLVKKEKKQHSESLLWGLLHWIPPAHWAERWPDKAFFKKALIEATIRYRDEAWALKILEYQALAMEDLEISELQYAQLSALLSTEVFQQLIGRAWKDSDKDLESFGPAEELLLHSKHPWEATFSREWLGALQALLITSGGDSWNLWDYREFLRQAAYRVPALPDAPWLEGWGEISPRTLYLWKDDIDYFLRVVRFRIDMHKAFE